jgi:hypothetical protein
MTISFRYGDYVTCYGGEQPFCFSDAADTVSCNGGQGQVYMHRTSILSAKLLLSVLDINRIAFSLYPFWDCSSDISDPVV